MKTINKWEKEGRDTIRLKIGGRYRKHFYLYANRKRIAKMEKKEPRAKSLVLFLDTLKYRGYKKERSELTTSLIK